MDEIYVGIDWGGRVHSVCVVDAQGEKLWEAEVPHTREQVTKFADTVLSFANDVSQLKAVMEAPRGAMLEVLLEKGVAAYSINPKQLDRFRDRHTVSGAKDDRLDAYVLADSLRTDTHLFRRVSIPAEEILRLRSLSQSYESLSQQTITFGHQIEEELRHAFPHFVQLGQWHREPWLWELFEQSGRGRGFSRAKVGALLKKHGIRRHTPEAIHKVLRTEAMPLIPGSAKAIRERVLLLIPALRATHEQKRIAEQRMSDLFQAMTEEKPSEEGEHHDAAIIQSLPGIGTKNGAVILTCSDVTLAERNASAFRALAGTKPVSRRTGGKNRKPLVLMRRARNHRLANAVHLWAQVAVRYDARSKAHYAALRQRGATHARALRGVADRLIGLLFALLRTGSLFDSKIWNRGKEIPVPSAASST